MNQNLKKAIYYHSRSQWGRIEAKESINHTMATSNLRWHLMRITSLDHIDGQLISKANFLPFYFSTNFQGYEPPIAITNEFMKHHKMHIVR
jgi:hypothetical protein